MEITFDNTIGPFRSFGPHVRIAVTATSVGKELYFPILDSGNHLVFPSLGQN